MASFKIPRIGESDRQRRPANYQGVGGNARRQALKSKASLPTRKNVAGVSKQDKKTATSLASSPPPSFKAPKLRGTVGPLQTPRARDNSGDDLPEPGGHPEHLRKAAQANGFQAKPSPFAALKARTQALAKGAGSVPNLTQDADVSADDYLDQLFEKKPALERASVPISAVREKLAKARLARPILKPQRTITYEQPSEPESGDVTERREPHGTERKHDAGKGRASESGGGREQHADTEREQRQLATESPVSDAAQASSEATRGTARADAELYPRDSGKADDVTEGAQSVLGERQSDGRGRQGKATNDGSAREGGSEEDGSEVTPDGESTVIDASKMDPSLYEDVHADKKSRKKQAERVSDDGCSPQARNAGLIQDEGEVQSRGSQSGELDPKHASGAEVRHLPILPQGVTEYNERQEIDIANVLGDLSGVVCNNCAVAEKCVEFKEGAVCAYDATFEGLSSRDIQNVIPSMELIADLQMKRARRGVLIEAVSGGMIDPQITRQLEIAALASERVARLKAGASAVSTKSMTIISQSGQQPGGGLISKLLAGIGQLEQQPVDLVLNPDPAPVTALELKHTITTEPNLLPPKET